MGPIAEMSFDHLPDHHQSKIKTVLLEPEKIIMCCYRKWDPEQVYVLTNLRIITIVANTVSDVFYTDILTVKESKFRGIPIISPDIFFINIFGQDQQRQILGFQFDKIDELYNNFLGILRREVTSARMGEGNVKKKTDQSFLDRLAELNALLDNKLISPEEYNRLRESILKEI